jgi:peptidyl-dipeptidase A
LDDLWLFPWETPDLKQQCEQLWGQLRPFYQKLHAYVRMKLRTIYPDKMPQDGTIPAHLLGNMWAQTWSGILNSMEGIDPYPDVPTIDVTEAMNEQVIFI